MAERVTKTSKVKEHLLKHGSITPWEAITLYKATRLSAIIFNLKKRGMNIETSIEYGKDCNGNTDNWAVYKLLTE